MFRPFVSIILLIMPLLLGGCAVSSQPSGASPEDAEGDVTAAPDNGPIVFSSCMAATGSASVKYVCISESGTSYNLSYLPSGANVFPSSIPPSEYKKYSAPPEEQAAPQLPEDAAHQFDDQRGFGFETLMLATYGALKCETRGTAWGYLAKHEINAALDQSVLQNVGPLDSPDSEEALGLIKSRFSTAETDIENGLTPEKCPAFNATGGVAAVDELIKEELQQNPL